MYVPLLLFFFFNCYELSLFDLPLFIYAISLTWLWCIRSELTSPATANKRKWLLWVLVFCAALKYCFIVPLFE